MIIADSLAIGSDIFAFLSLVFLPTDCAATITDQPITEIECIMTSGKDDIGKKKPGNFIPISINCIDVTKYISVN